MTAHWHAFSYTGPQRPRDADARDPQSATPPLEVARWLRKPRKMLAGTFATTDGAMGWLEEQLVQTPPMSSALPTPTVLEYARVRLSEHPGDQVTRYYTAGAYVCRDLVRCQGGDFCPGHP